MKNLFKLLILFFLAINSFSCDKNERHLIWVAENHALHQEAFDWITTDLIPKLPPGVSVTIYQEGNDPQVPPGGITHTVNGREITIIDEGLSSRVLDGTVDWLLPNGGYEYSSEHPYAKASQAAKNFFKDCIIEYGDANGVFKPHNDFRGNTKNYIPMSVHECVEGKLSQAQKDLLRRFNNSNEIWEDETIVKLSNVNTDYLIISTGLLHKDISLGLEKSYDSFGVKPIIRGGEEMGSYTPDMYIYQNF